MAEAKKKKIVSADTGKEVEAGSKRSVKQAAPVGNATGYRVGAVLLWIVAIALEVVAVLMFIGKIDLKFMQVLYQMIAALVLDLIFVIIGSTLWKKANHIKPASEKNPVLFWLWNNMGLIVCAFAFIPFVILALTNKNADKKTKAVATVVAIIAMLIGGLVSYDWNPVSKEEKDAAMTTITTDVYWAPFGRVYHTHEDCGHLNKSEKLTVGSVEKAIEEGRTRLCSSCAKKDDIQGVATDGSSTSDDSSEDTTTAGSNE